MRLILKVYCSTWSSQTLALLTLSIATSSQAYEYSLDYSVNGRVEYNDNVSLKVENPKTITGGRVFLPVDLTMRGDQFSGSLLGSVSVRRFDDSSYNSDDSNLESSALYLAERGSVSGRAGFKRTSTQETQFLDGGEEVGSSSRVDITTAGSSGNYQLTEPYAIIAGINYSAREYESPQLIDGKFFSGSAGLVYQWTELTSLRLQGTASHYENEARLQVTSDSIGLEAGFNSALTERLTTSFLGGWTTVDTSYSSQTAAQVPSDTSNSGYVLNGTLNFKEERYSLSALISRRATPSSNGYLLVSDSLVLAYDYTLSERANLSLDLQAGHSNALDERINNDRTFGEADLAFRYRLAQSWIIGGSYRLRYQDKESQDDSVYSNAVYFTVSFDPERLLWSR